MLDAFFFAKPFTLRLQERFGPAGVCVFVAFLCACKRNQPQGQFSYMSDVEALQNLGLAGVSLVDGAGSEWSLDEFWAFTGKMKQTRKKTIGTQKNVKSTHWERWQETLTREMAAERQRRLRAQNERDSAVTENEQARDSRVADLDLDLDLPPPTPPRGSGRRFASNRNGKPQPTAPPVPDWQPEPPPGDVVASSAVAKLRANPSGKSQ